MSIINGKRILVVDGDIGPRETIRIFFETYGAIVRTAEDGCEALKIIETNPFDLITTCLHLDRINGLELCSEIHARSITAPVVVITANINTNREIEGVVDIIAKPFDLQDFKRRIEKALENTQKRMGGVQ